jgi:cell wall-active antibiotic response 4TMS protein YvqF/uncharacterized protein DUF1707
MNNGSDSSLERFREEVIEKLSSSYSRDYLNESEFEDRVEQATAADSHEALRKLLIDLPLAGAPDPPVPVDGRSDPQLSHGVRGGLAINSGEVRSESTALAIFSGAERKGVWDPPRTLNAIAMFGGCDIDLRDARIPAGGMTINAVVMFGGVDIIVPEDLNVEVSGAGIFGAFDGKNHRGSSDPNTPTIKIDGVAIFGGVDIKIKRR